MVEISNAHHRRAAGAKSQALCALFPSRCTQQIRRERAMNGDTISYLRGVMMRRAVSADATILRIATRYRDEKPRCHQKIPGLVIARSHSASSTRYGDEAIQF